MAVIDATKWTPARKLTNDVKLSLFMAEKAVSEGRTDDALSHIRAAYRFAHRIVIDTNA